MPGRIELACRSLLLALAIGGCSQQAKPAAVPSTVELTPVATGVQFEATSSQVFGGGDGLELTDVRGALAAPSGVVALADAGLHQVLIVDPSEGQVARVGRQGAGPGEFDDISLVAFWGDSLAAYDPAQHRLSFLRRDGTLIRQQRIDNAGLVVPSILGIRRDGLSILKGIVLAPSSSGAATFPIRGQVRLVHGERMDTIADYDEGRWHPRGPLFYAWRATGTATDSGVWIGAGGRPELRLVDWKGDLRVTLRWPARARAVTAADRAKIIGIAEARRAAPELTDDDRFADSIPYFGRVLSDPAGGLWVIAATAPYEAPDSAWRVDEVAGTIQGLALPARFRPTQIGSDFILGVRTDEDGSPRVVRFGLRR